MVVKVDIAVNRLVVLRESGWLISVNTLCLRMEKNFLAKPKKAVKNNPYNISYEEVCAEVMGPKQKEQLRRVIGFRFKRHESLNLPEEHLQAIEKHLEGRVRKLLAIPTRHLKQEKAR